MATTVSHAFYDTPFGDFHVFADAQGVVRASGFGSVASVAVHLPAGLLASGWIDGSLPDVDSALEAWLDGDGSALARVQVAQAGGPFFQEVWDTLREVPAGEPLSYQELAAAAGRPRAMRAVGTACARNALGLFVPCHRVIAAAGRLGHYGYGGPGIKAAMLAHEAGYGKVEILTAQSAAHAGALAPVRALRAGSPLRDSLTA